MSKFIEMLEKTREEAPAPLGFGAASRQNAGPPQIVLVGQASADELEKNSALSDTKADAILVTLSSLDDKVVGAISDSLDGKLWGVQIGAINQEQASSLKEKGCDFIVFDAESTSASILNDEDLGKVISASPDIDEDAAQAVHGLPIDGALFSPSESLLPLTVQKLLDIGIVLGMMGKLAVISAPSDLGQPDVEAFRNAGISGIVVNLSASEDVASLKESIVNLPRRKPKARKGLMAQAPSAGFVSLARSDDDEEDDEEEE